MVIICAYWPMTSEDVRHFTNADDSQALHKRTCSHDQCILSTFIAHTPRVTLYYYYCTTTVLLLGKIENSSPVLIVSHKLISCHVACICHSSSSSPMWTHQGHFYARTGLGPIVLVKGTLNSIQRHSRHLCNSNFVTNI